MKVLLFSYDVLLWFGGGLGKMKVWFSKILYGKKWRSTDPVLVMDQETC